MSLWKESQIGQEPDQGSEAADVTKGAFKKAYPIRTALLGLAAIPLFALMLALAYDTYGEYKADTAEAFHTASTIRAISAAQTEQFLANAKFALSELSRRPRVQALDGANCDPQLAEIKKLQLAYADLLTLDAKGRLVCSASGIAPGQAAGADPKFYFSEVVRTRQFAVGKPAKDFITGRWVSTLAYPILNDAGQLKGVAAMAVDLVNFQSLISHQDVPPLTVIGIINNEGTVIARSQDAAQRVGSVSGTEVSKVMLQERQGTIRSRDYQGVDRFYAFGPIANSDWIAFVSLDEATILAPVIRLAFERLALMIALVLAVATITALLARRIAKPIEAISRTIANVGAGKVDARASLTGPTELRQIATQLNAMLDARLQAEADLRHSEDRYRTLVEWTPEPIAVHRGGKILYANPAALKMFGADSASGVIGTQMMDRVHPDFRQIVVARMKNFADHDLSSPMMLQKLLKLDGAVIDVEVQGTTISYDGEPALHVAMHDVTEQKKEEALLQVSLRLRKYGLDHSLDEVLTKTLDEAEALTGSQIGFFHFLEADQKTLWLQNWSTRTLQEICTAEGKMQHYCVDQAGVWVDCIRERGPVIHNDYPSLPHRKGLPEGHAPISRELVVPIQRGETIVGILGVGNKPADYSEKDVQTVSRLADLAWDVVAARRAEQALREANLHWKTTFDATQDAICLLDSDQKVLQANASMAALTGVSVENMTGRNCWELVHRTTAPIPECPLRRAHTSLRREQMELRIGNLWLDITVDPVLGEAQSFQGAVHIIRDITERKQLEEQVRQLAFYDVLTDLPNRRLMIDRLDQAMTASKRTGRYGALMFLDLDNFKPVNDMYGHEAGDLLLREVAKRLISCVREIDTVSRFGGDEFAVLLSDLIADKAESTKEVGTIAEKIRIKLAEPYLLAIRRAGSAIATVQHRCSASMGAVVFMNHEYSLEDILRRADTAMYQAKDAGRNNVVFHEANDED